LLARKPDPAAKEIPLWTVTPKEFDNRDDY
jgi:hypothetical protein